MARRRMNSGCDFMFRRVVSQDTAIGPANIRLRQSWLKPAVAGFAESRVTSASRNAQLVSAAVAQTVFPKMPPPSVSAAFSTLRCLNAGGFSRYPHEIVRRSLDSVCNTLRTCAFPFCRAVGRVAGGAPLPLIARDTVCRQLERPVMLLIKPAVTSAAHPLVESQSSLAVVSRA